MLYRVELSLSGAEEDLQRRADEYVSALVSAATDAGLDLHGCWPRHVPAAILLLVEGDDIDELPAAFFGRCGAADLPTPTGVHVATIGQMPEMAGANAEERTQAAGVVGLHPGEVCDSCNAILFPHQRNCDYDEDGWRHGSRSDGGDSGGAPPLERTMVEELPPTVADAEPERAAREREPAWC
jgi:hypothetical protein